TQMAGVVGGLKLLEFTAERTEGSWKLWLNATFSWAMQETSGSSRSSHLGSRAPWKNPTCDSGMNSHLLCAQEDMLGPWQQVGAPCRNTRGDPCKTRVELREQGGKFVALKAFIRKEEGLKTNVLRSIVRGKKDK
ncbi:hypothetical protein H1C71_027597, partial [Ictidomys tridecemlineatus]